MRPSLTTPVVFMIFNRPELTARVFNAIAQVKPKTVFVIADGPRFPEEAGRCEEARSVLQRIDWDCEVNTNFSATNLGCKYRVASGLDWVFSQVEEAIILEDDCLPSPSFFFFCQQLLEKYRDDERIMWITGNNFQNGHSRTEYGYYFSKYNHGWGWASWRRVWQFYDVEMKAWPNYKAANLLPLMFDDSYEYRYWVPIFEDTFRGKIDTWDYQTRFLCWSQNGLTIIPNANLVSNIGFGKDATHTTTASHLAEMPTHDMWEITHPPFVIRHREADLYTFDTMFGGQEMRMRDRQLHVRLKRKLSRLRTKILHKLAVLKTYLP
ncbi:hypothetical protein U14_01806 [Candidatus Moduliflexus flocculans]|uniref:Hemolytic protein HlpA-like protein n=1 Tax=Candidatus Moduliflexus flocculans TaxID=1499966 RepID=A0A0S6VZF6_9BACT|nr:hypothetical protein U14_01806 [Candidatus Moduliflexus flocculans]